MTAARYVGYVPLLTYSAKCKLLSLKVSREIVSSIREMLFWMKVSLMLIRSSPINLIICCFATSAEFGKNMETVDPEFF